MHLLIPNYIYETIPLSKKVLDRNGKTIHLSLTQDEKYRVWTPTAQINEKFTKTILDKEDRYFFYHFGVNPVSLFRSTLTYLKGEKGPGASTISMQLARLYFKLKTRSIAGKLKQILYASLLELTLSKDEILEAYLNLIPMGKNIEGIETAANFYFRSSSHSLSEIDIAFFSLLPQAPERMSLFQKGKLKSISAKMTKIYPDFSKDEIEYYLKSLSLSFHTPFQAPHFVQRILAERKDCKIETTLDLKMQNELEALLKDYVRSIKRKGIHNATTLVVNARSGEVLSYIGSKDFFDESIDGQVDGIRARRSPGSILKPFIFAKAFDKGLYLPESVTYDSPLSYRTPENYDRSYLGPISISNALILSRNIPAVAINHELKEDGLYDFLKLNAIYIPHAKGHYGSSIALGSLELNSMELAKLYALLANNGRVTPLSLYPQSKKEKKDEVHLIGPEASILVKDILGKHHRPGYQSADYFRHKEGKVYWKTGTSFGFRDAWSAGIWNDYVIVSWVGDFKSRSNPYLIGSKVAAPLFFRVVDYLRENTKTKNRDIFHTHSSKVSEVAVCTVSGKLPNDHCPRLKTSLFIPGKSPIHRCKTHRKITVNLDESYRTCAEYKGKTKEQVYEYFSTEKIKLYAKFGIKLTLPPKFHPVCKRNALNHIIGEAPRIINPKKGFIYLIEKGRYKMKIPLHVKADSDVENISWYLDGILQKRQGPEAVSFLDLPPGNYRLQAIDDKGRIDSRLIRVQNTL